MSVFACRDRPVSLPRAFEARLSAEIGYSDCELPRAEAEGTLGGTWCEPKQAGLQLSGTNSPLSAVAALIALDRDAAALGQAASGLETPRSDLDEVARKTALGAIEHARAKVHGRPDLLLDAFEYTEEALVELPASATALFNRALIAADLGLCRVARHAWSQYLEVDWGSGWAAEARRRSESLRCRFSGRFHDPDELFSFSVNELLGEWATNMRAHPAMADETRVEMARIGESLAREGDPAVLKLAEELVPPVSEERIQAIEQLVEGRRRFSAYDYPGAYESLERAAAGLGLLGSVLEPWCQAWLASVDVYEGRFDVVEQRLVRLEIEEYPRILGRVKRTLGWAALRQRQLETAHRRLSAAAEAYSRGGYASSVAAVLTMSGETLGMLGFLRESWADRHLAISGLQKLEPRHELHNALLDGAEVAQHLGASATAAALLDEAAMVSEEKGEPIDLVEVLLWRGQGLRRRGLDDEASSIFRRALVEAEAIPIGQDQPREQFVSEARLGLWSDLRTELTDSVEFASVIEYFRRKGHLAFVLEAYRVLSARALADGDLAAATSALDRALEVIAGSADDMVDASYAVRFADSVKAIYDQRIAVAIEQSRDREALELLEAGRRAGASRRPLVLDASAGGAAILVYAILEREIVWWLVDGSSQLCSGRIPRAIVQETADAVFAALSRGSEQSKALSLLYELLVGGPLDCSGVELGRPLILVPDGFLQRLPFAALRNPATGVRLVEERRLSYRDSLEGGSRRRMNAGPRKQRTSWRLLSVGDPAFDPSLLRWLKPLDGARGEARRVAALYTNATLLTGREATLERVRHELSSSQALHLAAHARASDDGSRETLALAASGGSSGLASTEMLLSGVEDLQLVILSACGSVGSRPSRAGGLQGLARPFIANGVPAVIGTLWPVRDQELPDLMEELHLGLLEGLAASEALQRVQVKAAQDPRRCCDWAALKLIGDLPAEAVPNN